MTKGTIQAPPTEVTYHLFNYPTHAETWIVYHNATPQNVRLSQLCDAQDGGELAVYHDFHHTYSHALKRCSPEVLPDLFSVTVINHATGTVTDGDGFPVPVRVPDATGRPIGLWR